MHLTYNDVMYKNITQQSRILTITYNAYYNLGLREINSLATKNSNRYNLRKSLNVVLNRPKTELGRRSFVHRSAITWNALPDNLKDSPNSSIFKHNLKQSKQTIMNISGGQLESLRYFDHHTHFITCTVIILSCNHVL